MSTDNSNLVINKNIENDERFKLVVNSEKKYALGNIVSTLVDNKFDDEDVNILLDGDDWLPCGNVLSRLDKEYSEKECLMTYGSYVYFPHGKKGR
jgi:glycosyltransferase involved in cell wall biosynthesis